MRFTGIDGVRVRISRLAALMQLAFLEANSRGTRRFTGMARARRMGAKVGLWAIGPMMVAVALDVLLLHRNAIWWCLAIVTGAWGLSLVGFMFSVAAISLYRAARLRSAQDKRGLSRYPRYPRRV